MEGDACHPCLSSVVTILTRPPETGRLFFYSNQSRMLQSRFRDPDAEPRPEAERSLRLLWSRLSCRPRMALRPTADSAPDRCARRRRLGSHVAVLGRRAPALRRTSPRGARRPVSSAGLAGRRLFAGRTGSRPSAWLRRARRGRRRRAAEQLGGLGRRAGCGHRAAGGASGLAAALPPPRFSACSSAKAMISSACVLRHAGQLGQLRRLQEGQVVVRQEAFLDERLDHLRR